LAERASESWLRSSYAATYADSRIGTPSPGLNYLLTYVNYYDNIS
jgi:hypothetical protein